MTKKSLRMHGISNVRQVPITAYKTSNITRKIHFKKRTSLCLSCLGRT